MRPPWEQSHPPQICRLGDGGASDAADEAERRERAREARIRQGMQLIDKAFAPFDASFYGGLKQSYLDYASPQVEDQFSKARDQLAFALARQGILSSSAADKRSADLAADRELEVANMVNRGQDYADSARSSLEQERGIITSQLQATADPQAAANAARAQADIAKTKPAFDVIGPLFQNATAGLVLATTPRYFFDAGGNVRSTNMWDQIFEGGSGRIVQ